MGNIRGADAGSYLTNTNCDKGAVHSVHHQPNSPFGGCPPFGGMLSPPQLLEDDGIRCSCGFSAVVNRKLAYGSGLFYEDEMEITGIAEDPGEKKKSSLLSYLMSTNTLKLDPSIDREQIDNIPHSILELIREQCVFIPSAANSIYRAARYLRTKAKTVFTETMHVLEFTDSNEITNIALEQSKYSYETTLSICKMEDGKSKSGNGGNFAMHRWPFLRARGPQCNQDIVRVMRSLQPLLQEAIQKKCQTRLWEAPSAVKGPLTWRQFHR